MNLLLCIGSPTPSEVEIHETHEHYLLLRCVSVDIFDLELSVFSSFFKVHSGS